VIRVTQKISRARHPRALTSCAGVTNLFDKEPAIVGGTIGQTQPGTYDIIGCAFFIDGQINF
jgi:hypothetical protein